MTNTNSYERVLIFFVRPTDGKPRRCITWFVYRDIFEHWRVMWPANNY